MKISELPSAIRMVALQRQIECTDNLFTNKTTDELNLAFDWDSTLEGYDFWESWCEKESILQRPLTDEEAILFAHKEEPKLLKETKGKLLFELDFEFIKSMAQRMSKNKDKYDPYSFKKPIDVEELKQALFRHVMEVMQGNYQDEGDALGHIEAIALNAMIINYQLKHNK